MMMMMMMMMMMKKNRTTPLLTVVTKVLTCWQLVFVRTARSVAPLVFWCANYRKLYLYVFIWQFVFLCSYTTLFSSLSTCGPICESTFVFLDLVFILIPQLSTRVVSVSIGYWWTVRNSISARFLSPRKRPDGHWGPPNLTFNAYRVPFPQG